MAHIWLIGMMGSGKTTVGRILAERLSVPFVDTDDAVVNATGRSIEELFSDGEDVFRTAERDVITRVAGCNASVVATGGGAVLDAANVAAMRRSGSTVLLTADPHVLADRITDAAGRPLLAGGGDVLSIARERSDAYADAADVIVDTTMKSIEEVLDEVVRCVAM